MATNIIKLDAATYDTFSAFKKALKAGDVDNVRRLMTDAIHQSENENKRNTPSLKQLQYAEFLRAIGERKLKMVNTMLRAGVDVEYLNMLSDQEPGPLKIAIRIPSMRTRWKMVDMLLEFGVGLKVDSPTPCLYQQSCVHDAVRQADRFLLYQLLQKAGAQMNHLHRPCLSQLVSYAPIHMAVMHLEREDCETMIKGLVRLGADVNIRTSVPPGLNCLNLVLERENDRCEITKVLLDCGAQVNSEIDFNIIADDARLYVYSFLDPLASAASQGDYEVAKLMMIEAGANVNSPRWKSSPQTSALYLAVKEEHTAIVQLLLDHGADVDAKADDGANILCVAAKNFDLQESGNNTDDYIAILKMLLARCVDKNPTEVEDYIPFGSVLSAGTLEAVHLFLENGVQLNNCGVKFPLHRAMNNARHRAPEILEYLLKSGLFDVDEADDEGTTPLFASVDYARNSDCLRLLVEWGADVNINRKLRNEESGESLLDAVIDLHHGTADILLSAGAAINWSNFRDYKDSYSGWRKSRKFKYFMKHAVLFQSQKHLIDVDTKKLLVEVISSAPEIAKQCSVELEALKNVNFYGSVSLYDVLIGKDITRYTGNSHVVERFETLKVTETFPFYGSQIQCSYSLACVRWQVVQKATENLSKLLNFRFGHGVLYEIISHLHMKDLRNLCKIYT